MDKNVIIQASELCKSFKTGSSIIQVLNRTSLEITKGERLFIVGASGAGKSTLLHVLGTLEKPDKGVLLLENKDVLSLSPLKLSLLRNKCIGFVFQFHHLLDEFNALENVALPGYVYSKNWKSVQAKAKKLLGFVGLENRLKHKPNQLSGGEQQRVAIARSLINSPSIILMDEPTGDLDEDNSIHLMELISRLSKDWNQTVVIVTHNLALCKWGDRTLELRSGLLHPFK